MKLTKNEINALVRVQERIDKMKTAVAERAYHEKDTNDAETDGTIEGLEVAAAGLEQVIEQYYC